jgi:hypothetical protein
MRERGVKGEIHLGAERICRSPQSTKLCFWIIAPSQRAVGCRKGEVYIAKAGVALFYAANDMVAQDPRDLEW